MPFGESVVQFRRWFNSVGGPPAAEQDIAELEQLAQHFQGKFDPLPEFDGLWDLAHPPRVAIMRRNGLDLLNYRRLGVWRGAKGKIDGPRLAEEAEPLLRRLRCRIPASRGKTRDGDHHALFRRRPTS